MSLPSLEFVETRLCNPGSQFERRRHLRDVSSLSRPSLSPLLLLATSGPWMSSATKAVIPPGMLHQSRIGRIHRASLA